MASLSETLEWQKSALCRQTDPELFFPLEGQSSSPAKKICKGCEVRLTCLQYALDNEIEHGVWGGLGGWQLQQLRRKRNRARRVG